jgi:hypothetical protein
LTGAEPKQADARPTIDHPVEEWLVDLILDELTTPADRELALVVLAGNSGDGKSHLLREIRRTLKNRDGLDDSMVEWVLDATHAKERTESSGERLDVFFAPFADGGDWSPSKLHVIAINTGAVIKFLADTNNRERQYGDLDRVLSCQLGIKGTSSEGWSREFARRFDKVLVIDLDRRMLINLGSTPGEFLNRMLDTLAIDGAEGVLATSSNSCGTCTAADACPVYANLRALQLPVVRERLGYLLLDIGLEDRVHVGPRAMWHLCYQLTVGGLDGARIREGKPLISCRDIRNITEDERAAALFFTALFEGNGDTQAGGGAALLAEFRRLDPQFRFSLSAYELGLTAGLAKAEELASCTPVAERIGIPPSALVSVGDAVDRATGAVRRNFFFGDDDPDPKRHAWLRAWADQLQRYREYALSRRVYQVQDLLSILKRVLEDMYRPRREGGANLWALKLPWRGVTDLYTDLPTLRAERRMKPDVRVLGPDVFRDSLRPRTRELADKLQSLPLMIRVPLKGELDIPVNWPLYRLLRRVAEGGYVSGSLDPERLQQLERIGASLGAQAADEQGVAVFGDDGVLLCEKTQNGEIDVISF